MSAADLKHRSPFTDTMASARRAEMLREAAGARRDLRQGKVKRGSAADLMAELRSK